MTAKVKTPTASKWHSENGVHTLVVHGFPLKGGNQMLRLQHILDGKEYRENIGVLVCAAGRPTITGKAKVECYRTYRTRPLDEDNAMVAFKPVIDWLVKAGVIQADSPDMLVRSIPHQLKKVKGGADWAVEVSQA